MARLRTTAASLAANGIGAALGQVIEVIALLGLARVLSATDVATYFLILQGIRFVYIFESGMGQDLTRSLAGTFQLANKGAQRSMKSGAVWYLWLFAISTALVFLGTLVLLVANSEVNDGLFFLVGFAISIRIVSDGCTRALTGLMMLIRTRSISLLRSVGLLIVTFVLAPIGANPFGVGLLCLEIVLLLVSFIPLRHRVYGSWKYPRYTTKEYRQVVTPMAKANVTGFLSNRLDGFFVGIFAGTPGVVIHGILLRVYDVARGGIELLMTGVVQATSISSRTRNKVELSLVLTFAVGISSIVAAISSVLVFVARPFLDDALPQTINVSTWTYLAVATALFMVSQSVAHVYVATGLNKVNHLLFGVYLSSALNFATTLIATRLLGVAGPFIGIAVGGLVSTLAHPWSLRAEISDWADASRIYRIWFLSSFLFVAATATSLLVGSSSIQVGIAFTTLVVGSIVLRSFPTRQFLAVAHRAR